jgi:nicotinate dehydrogenase subunit B
MKKDQDNAGKPMNRGGRYGGMKRRNFFKLLGGGLFIFVRPFEHVALPDSPAGQGRSLPKDFNAFLQVTEDGVVNCYTGKVEMGQGAMTSLPQMMADELDVQYEKVKMIMSDTSLCPWDPGTITSMTVRSFGMSMRAAAAEAKAVLMQMASEQLHVPLSRLEVKDGVISDIDDSRRKVSYGELTRGKRIDKHLEGKAVLKDPAKFKYIGKPFLRRDSQVKVTGEARYTGDFHLPGMLYARLYRPPSHGAKLVSADVSEAEKIKGIIAIREGDTVAVLGDNRDLVDQSILKIKTEYSFNEINVDERTIFDRILKADSTANIVKSNGDIETGRGISDIVIESEFRTSYVAHALMEPHTATAMAEGDKITVWVSASTPFQAQETIAREMKVAVDNVRVITPFVGSCFCDRSASAHRHAVMAVKLARKTGKPVNLTLAREDEFFWDPFRPAAVVKIASGMEKSGKMTLWDFHEYYAGPRGSDTVYDVPHFRTTDYSKGSVHPFGTGAWRAQGNSTNTFARESQINIMAAKAGMDQLDFRLRNLKDERMVALLKAAADLFGYSQAGNPSGRGYGIACGTDIVGSCLVQIAEVKVDENTGHVQVIRVACSMDMGLCVNPQGAKLQIEGGITLGLGYALTEEIQFQGGNIKNLNFDKYDIPRFSGVPRIDIKIMDKKDQPPQGCGEPPVICMGALIANAVFDATGARLYQLPMTPGRILAAIKKV